jgi:hypothetical protein
MNQNDLSSGESGVVCLRCNKLIKPHDRLFIMAASLENETPAPAAVASSHHFVFPVLRPC